MKRIPLRLRLSPRRACIGLAIGAAVGLVALADVLLPPAYDQWCTFQAQVQARATDYERLERALSIRQAVDEQYAALGPRATQTDSDEICLSRILEHLESLCRHPNMTVVSMKPMPVKDMGSHKLFPVRFSVSGSLQDVTRMASGLSQGPGAVGVEAFSIRAIQGSNMVECTMSIQMLMAKAKPEPAVPGKNRIKAAPKARATGE